MFDVAWSGACCIDIGQEAGRHKVFDIFLYRFLDLKFYGHHARAASPARRGTIERRRRISRGENVLGDWSEWRPRWARR